MLIVSYMHMLARIMKAVYVSLKTACRCQWHTKPNIFLGSKHFDLATNTLFLGMPPLEAQNVKIC